MLDESGTDATIGTVLARAARKFGSARYLVTPTSSMTYASALDESSVAARHLLDRGIGKGVRVGLFIPAGRDWLVWWLAAARVGAVTVPLNTRYKPRELRTVLRLADVQVLLITSDAVGDTAQARLERALPELLDAGRENPGEPLHLPSVPFLREVVHVGEPTRAELPWASRVPPASEPRASGALLAELESEVRPADVALIVHTSGTTADPKGVVHTHGTLVRQTSSWVPAVGMVTSVSEDQRVLCAMPFFWIGGVLAALGALHHPITLLVVPDLDPGDSLALLEQERGTGVIGWATFTQRLRAHPTFADRDLRSAPMLHGHPADIAMFGVPGGVPVHRGMTESAGSFLCTETLIVDAGGAPVELGETGELLIRGPGSMVGYNKRERHDVFDADGWYHTGDQVFRLDGDPRLYYAGRETELIKSAGSNVSPREVEVVLEELDAVSQCVVLGIDHADRGEEVCAVVVPARPEFDPAQVRFEVGTLLSAYKVPTRWIVVSEADLPSLATGKPDRRRLRALIQGEELS